MIYFSQCPCRISLLGGGTDLDWFVNAEGYGYSLGFAINSYSNIVGMLKPNISQIGVLNYSSREEYRDIRTISHPLFREALIKFDLKVPLELCSLGAPSGGHGLGGSSSFLNALISILCALTKKNMTKLEIADLACKIEIDVLHNNIGRQDQYLSALGGVNTLKFDRNGVVRILKNINVTAEVEELVSTRIFIIDSGIKRSASAVLAKVRNSSNSLRSLILIRSIFENLMNELDDPNIDIKESILTSVYNSWSIKREMDGVMNSDLIEISNFLYSHNINVLKLIGAGGGGYFLAESLNKDEAIRFCNANNLRTMDFSIDYNGLSTRCIAT